MCYGWLLLAIGSGSSRHTVLAIPKKRIQFCFIILTVKNQTLCVKHITVSKLITSGH